MNRAKSLFIGFGALLALFAVVAWSELQGVKIPGYNAAPGLTLLCTNADGTSHWAEKTAYSSLTVSNTLAIRAGESFFIWFAELDGGMVWSNSATGLLLRYNSLAGLFQTPKAWSFEAGLLVSAANITNKVTYQNLVVSGAGNGNTNYTLLAGRTMYLGSSNVNISAVMDYDAVTTTEFASVSITNLSANTWGLSFSAVTNRWFWSGVYGTNAPTVLTNNTRLELSLKSKGTNTWVGYTYYAPAQ